MRSLIGIARAVTLFAAAAHANMPGVASPGGPMNSSPDRAIVIQDDALEFATVLSTRAADAKMHPLDEASWGDSFLRAAVDKRNQTTKIEVVQRLRFLGPQREYKMVHYLHDENLVRAQLESNDTDRAGCGSNAFNADCMRDREISFPIDEQLVRSIAARPYGAWSFRLKDLDGNDLNASIDAVEAAGLMRLLDRHRSSPMALSD